MHISIQNLSRSLIDLKKKEKAKQVPECLRVYFVYGPFIAYLGGLLGCLTNRPSMTFSYFCLYLFMVQLLWPLAPPALSERCCSAVSVLSITFSKLRNASLIRTRNIRLRIQCVDHCANPSLHL